MSNPTDAMYLAYRIPFGQYTGQAVEEIIDEDPSYIVWVHDNVESIHIPEKWYKICKLSKPMFG